ncbi:gamma-glutamyl-gamma-aminobutyrate hydrolase family protein [bacterium]|nr:gamma-glutamyl-gamma-aminobutyrate hydrolase family protein [bacterium]
MIKKMKNILIINNSLDKNNFDFVKNITKVVSCPGIHYSEITPDILKGYEGIILSGNSLEEENAVKRNIPYYQWIMDTEKAVLGICAGHQIIAKLFGSQIIHRKNKHMGMCDVFVDNPSPILNGCSKKFIVYHLHKDIGRLPQVFMLLAHSHNNEVEVMKHRSRPIWGIQFHPEKTKKGRLILKNFTKLV